MNAQILLADDDASIRFVLSQALSKEGFAVRATGNVATLLKWAKDGEGDVILSDVYMGEENVFDALPAIRTLRPLLPVIVMSAQSTVATALSAANTGAFDYLPKPFDLDALIATVRRALAGGPDAATRASTKKAARDENLPLVGRSPAMQEVFRAIGRLSNSNATVLITGESGSGKELVARALHDHSSRAKKMFVALNTAAIPRDLLESELFGHERGAFTGAQQSRPGRFEQAEGGTLFLDEIGDMPSELQTRLLRILSDGQYYRVGGQQPLRANVRVIAATHQDLEARVSQGLFREDLYHRLHVIRLRLPALRERREDIPMLARHFLQKSARNLGGETKRLSAQALAAMTAFDWPGNVRQLENVCHWLTVMAPSVTVGAADLPPELRADSSNLGAATESRQPGPRAAPEAISIAEPNPRTSPVGGAASPPADFTDRTQSNDRKSLGNGANGLAGGSPDHDPPGMPAGASPSHFTDSEWSNLLQRQVSSLLDAQPIEQRLNGASELMDLLTRQFESTIIKTALQHTRGRRIEAALRLGIGRNTITRKIQDLRLEE